MVITEDLRENKPNQHSVIEIVNESLGDGGVPFTDHDFHDHWFSDLAIQLSLVVLQWYMALGMLFIGI